VHSTLLQSVDAVLDLDEYKPTNTVNSAFTNLVDGVVNATPEGFNVPHHKREKLRKASSMAETEMELYWAKTIVESIDPAAALETFPYIENYRELVARELGCLTSSGMRPDSVRTALMIGSGPLPLTALCLSSYDVRVDHIDSSSDAMALCERITKVLDVEGDCIFGTGESAELTKQYDLILVAALAGTNQEEKQAIINNVLPHLAHDGRIIVRSAKGARELLYPALNPAGFAGVNLLHEYHPDDYVINSVLVYAKEKK